MRAVTSWEVWTVPGARPSFSMRRPRVRAARAMGGTRLLLGVEGYVGLEGVEVFGHEFGRGGPLSQ